ncbi:hypothetical protein CBR_g26405 [Chara braunii]|uniref:DDB1- and CUL4-associated factor 8 n=1 Tax=Chara braunii TaxID=69332 RepID=A0A388L7V0_CHABU|nr:hypothetical protein CBR_g26405 [Chara braunii]|eukprot:GBG78376.1 hypothetical protein CBR_g26405 [Chara braunii]
MDSRGLYRCSADELWRRETGLVSPLKYRRKAGGCEDLIRRLELASTLEGHEGCVNTVNFNPAGDLLVSGSDDYNIIIWDWAQAKKKLLYNSGHTNNIFQAKVMPYSDNKTIVSCAADGQVRCGVISEAGTVETRLLGKHAHHAQKLALFPGSPSRFLSCGEDGVVYSFDLREKNPCKLFTCRPRGSLPPIRFSSTKYIELYTIYVNPCNQNFFAVGGTDEFARVYDLRKCGASSAGDGAVDCPVDTFAPKHLMRDGADRVHITCLVYSHQEELLVSYNDELIYLFQKSQGLGENPREHAASSSSPSTSASSACRSDEGRPLPSLKDRPSPASSQKNEEEEDGCGISDAYGYPTSSLNEEVKVYKGHRNSKTIKGVNFLGPRDEYVISGSDCGHIFIWRKKDAKLVQFLKGDMDVVNAVEPHPHTTVLATSGIENNVKIWTPTKEKPSSLPENAKKVMDENEQQRDERLQGMRRAPHLVMHVSRMRRRARGEQSGADSLHPDSDEERFSDSDDDTMKPGCPIG